LQSSLIKVDLLMIACYLVKTMTDEYSPSIRLYVTDRLAENASINLDAEQSHYLVTVMRQKQGNIIELFNGRDGSFPAQINIAHKKSSQLVCLRQNRPQLTGADLWLVFAPVKRTRLDFMAQKATELGASVIWPCQTDYTQVGRVNTDRLEANAIEAAEQSGRLDIPELRPFQRLDAILADWPDDRVIIFCDELAAGKKWPESNLSELVSHKAAIIIGPEGGFSARERELLLAKDNIVRLSLGPRILRADTAALSALTLFQAFCGDWLETSS